MEKTISYGSYGEDDRPYSLKYANVPEEELNSFVMEGEKNPPKSWKEAWERSVDWGIKHGVRADNG